MIWLDLIKDLIVLIEVFRSDKFRGLAVVRDLAEASQ